MKAFFVFLLSLILASSMFISACSDNPVDPPDNPTTTLPENDNPATTTLPDGNGNDGDGSGFDVFGDDPDIRPPVVPA